MDSEATSFRTRAQYSASRCIQRSGVTMTGDSYPVFLNVLSDLARKDQVNLVACRLSLT